LKVIEPLDHHVFEWCELVHQFLDDGIDEYGWGVSENDLHTTYHTWDKKNWGWLLEHEGEIVGVLAGVVVPHFFNHKFLLFNEFMWYVRPEFRGTGGGLRLYRAAYDRCKEYGISRMVFGHTKHMKKDFIRIYEKLGFTYLETHYEKVIDGN
jgi:GNAT superfamily N-acetyltransferase